MIYIISNQSLKLKNDELNKIKKENIYEEYYFDLELVDDYDVISSQCSTDSLFGEKKLIIFNNIDLFETKTVDAKTKKYWTKILENHNENNTLVFYSNKINKNNVLYKTFMDQLKLIELKELEKKDKKNIIETYLKDNNIKANSSIIYELSNMLDGSADFLFNELEKIKLSDIEEITPEALKLITFDIRKEKIFAISDAIFKRDNMMIEEKYNLLINEGVSPLSIIELMISDISLLLNLFLYEHNNSISSLEKTNNYISENFHINKYRLMIMGKRLQYLGLNDLQNSLKKLMKLQITLKSTTIDNINTYVLIKLVNIFN